MKLLQEGTTHSHVCGVNVWTKFRCSSGLAKSRMAKPDSQVFYSKSNEWFQEKTASKCKSLEYLNSLCMN